jgi:CheY-like chemotaxis protein
MPYSTIGTLVSSNALGRPQLLIVNTDPLTRDLYTHILNLEGYGVETAGDGANALEWLEMEEFPASNQTSILEENGSNWVGWGSVRTGIPGWPRLNGVTSHNFLHGSIDHSGTPKHGIEFSRRAFPLLRFQRPHLWWSIRMNDLRVTSQASATREARLRRSFVLRLNCSRQPAPLQRDNCSRSFSNQVRGQKTSAPVTDLVH